MDSSGLLDGLDFGGALEDVHDVLVVGEVELKASDGGVDLAIEQDVGQGELVSDAELAPGLAYELV